MKTKSLKRFTIYIRTAKGKKYRYSQEAQFMWRHAIEALLYEKELRLLKIEDRQEKVVLLFDFASSSFEISVKGQRQVLSLYQSQTSSGRQQEFAALLQILYPPE